MSEHHPLDEVPHVELTADETALAARLLVKVLGHSRAFAEIDESELANRLFEASSERHRFFGENLFGDPAWDILLALYCLEADAKPLTVTALCAAARAPHSTALRWIHTMEEAGLLKRSPHITDKRCSLITLSEEGRKRMKCYLAHIAKKQSLWLRAPHEP